MLEGVFPTVLEERVEGLAVGLDRSRRNGREGWGLRAKGGGRDEQQERGNGQDREREFSQRGGPRGGVVLFV
jgi:hypothetical protein